MQENRFLRSRLKYEKNFLERYFNGETFHIRRKNGQPTFEREVRTSKGNVYRLRIYIGPNYPFEMPELVVCDSPKPMPIWEGGHSTHTWQPKDGLLKICFFRPSCWTRKNKLYEVFNKGEEWLEAYEKHLVTGRPIEDYVDEMEPSEEEAAEQRRLVEQFEQLMPEVLIDFPQFLAMANYFINARALDDLAKM